MALDSDVSNADAQLHVEFYEYDKEPFKGRPFVRIIVPGDKTNVIDQPARDDHKRRFQRQWLYFLSKSTDNQLIGTPLSTWHTERPEELTEGQLSELIILKFQTVEQVATASDSQIMRMGMGAAGIRQRAQTYLSSKNAQTSGAELQQAKAEIETLKAMVAQIAQLQASQPLVATKLKGKRGGYRPRKPKAIENVNNDNAPIGATGL